MVNLKTASIWLVLMILASGASCSHTVYGNEVDRCRDVRLEVAKDLKSVVESATFVGYYRATSADEPSASDPSNEDIEGLYSYRLTKEWGLVGNAPFTLNILGFSPFLEHPDEYLAAVYRHEKLVETGLLDYGSFPPVWRPALKTCTHVPRFRLGSSYLVLGGTDSSVSYEFIPDQRVDPLYQEVLRLIKEGP